MIVKKNWRTFLLWMALWGAMFLWVIIGEAEAQQFPVKNGLLQGTLNGTPTSGTVDITNLTLSGLLQDIKALSDPGADRVIAWDDSAGALAYLSVADFKAAYSIGTLAAQDANNVAITNGTATLTSLVAPTITGTNYIVNATGNLRYNFAGGTYTWLAAAQPTANQTITLPNTGGSDGGIVLTTAYADSVAVNPSFEGSTANAYETTIAITDPTADRTITIPDDSINLSADMTGTFLPLEAFTIPSALPDDNTYTTIQSDVVLKLSGTSILINSPGGDLTLTGSGIYGDWTFIDTVALPGDVDFTGANITGLDLSTITLGQVNIGTSDYGWTYNPAVNDGQMEIRFPGGTAAFYETGDPAAPYFYLPGTIEADALIGNITSSSITADGLVGVIPGDVMITSLSTSGGIYPSEEGEGSSGIPYSGTGVGRGPSPQYARYWASNYIDSGALALQSNWQWRTRAQANEDLMPSGTATVDMSSISAGGQTTFTVTIANPQSNETIGTTNTPTVHLGWSAALETGLVVAQARVSGTNTVTVTVANITGGAIDPASITCRASISPR